MSTHDVIVCGGGTAGSCAAIAAARQGARTLLIEQLGFLGGSQTASLVLPYMRYSLPDEQLVTGLHQEIIERMSRLPGEVRPDYFNYELMKYVLEDMALEAGVELLYHTFVSDTVVTDGRLQAVEIANKSGKRLLAAEQFIDCTGDADVAFLAGVPCESGRPEDGLNQSASLRFVMGNVDWEALAARLRELGIYAELPTVEFGFAKGYTQAPQSEALIDQAVADGVFTLDEGGYIQLFTIPARPGEVAFNCPRVLRVNGALAEDQTRIEIEGRKIIPKLIAFCKRYLAGFDQSYLLTTAVLPGIRESRRIIGEYVLDGDDVTQATRFADRIAKSCYPVDIHNPSGVGVEARRLPPGEYHDLPYRALVPLEVDGLLVAGRCISATFEAQAAIRIIPTCRALGQAAGIAAARCASEGTQPRQLDTAWLLSTLAACGANVS